MRDALVTAKLAGGSGERARATPSMWPAVKADASCVIIAADAGLTNLLWPTNGALMAMLAAAGVTFDAWLRFAVPLLVALLVLAAVAIGVGVTVGV